MPKKLAQWILGDSIALKSEIPVVQKIEPQATMPEVLPISSLVSPNVAKRSTKKPIRALKKSDGINHQDARTWKLRDKVKYRDPFYKGRVSRVSGLPLRKVEGQKIPVPGGVLIDDDVYDFDDASKKFEWIPPKDEVMRSVSDQAGIDPNEPVKGFVLVSDVDGVVRSADGDTQLEGDYVDPKIAQEIKSQVEAGHLYVRYLSGSAALSPDDLQQPQEEWRRDGRSSLGQAFIHTFGLAWLSQYQDRLEIVGAMGGQKLRFNQHHQPVVEFDENYTYNHEQMFDGLRAVLQSYLTIVAQEGKEIHVRKKAEELLRQLADLQPSSEVLTSEQGSRAPEAFRDIMLTIRSSIDSHARLVNRGSDLQLNVTNDLFPLQKVEGVLNSLLTDKVPSFAYLDPEQKVVTEGGHYLKISKSSKAVGAKSFVDKHKGKGFISISMGDAKVDLPMFGETQLSFFVGGENELGGALLDTKTIYMRDPKGQSKTHINGTLDVLSRMREAVNGPFKKFKWWMASKDGVWRLRSLEEMAKNPAMVFEESQNEYEKSLESAKPGSAARLTNVGIGLSANQAMNSVVFRPKEELKQELKQQEFEFFEPEYGLGPELIVRGVHGKGKSIEYIGEGTENYVFSDGELVWRVQKIPEKKATLFAKMEDAGVGPRLLDERIVGGRKMVVVDKIRPRYAQINSPKAFSIKDLYDYQKKNHLREQLTPAEEKLVFRLIRDLRGDGHSFSGLSQGLGVHDFSPNNIVIGYGPFGLRAYLIDDGGVYEDSRLSGALYWPSSWIGELDRPGRRWWLETPGIRNRLTHVITDGLSKSLGLDTKLPPEWQRKSSWTIEFSETAEEMNMANRVIELLNDIKKVITSGSITLEPHQIIGLRNEMFKLFLNSSPGSLGRSLMVMFDFPDTRPESGANDDYVISEELKYFAKDRFEKTNGLNDIYVRSFINKVDMNIVPLLEKIKKDHHVRIRRDRDINETFVEINNAQLNNSAENKRGPGGIDLTAKRMDLEVDSGKAGVDQSIVIKTLDNIKINGLYIKDIEVKPLKNLPELLGVSAR